MVHLPGQQEGDKGFNRMEGYTDPQEGQWPLCYLYFFLFVFLLFLLLPLPLILYNNTDRSDDRI